MMDFYICGYKRSTNSTQRGSHSDYGVCLA